MAREAAQALDKTTETGSTTESESIYSGSSFSTPMVLVLRVVPSLGWSIKGEKCPSPLSFLISDFTTYALVIIPGDSSMVSYVL